VEVVLSNPDLYRTGGAADEGSPVNDTRPRPAVEEEAPDPLRFTAELPQEDEAGAEEEQPQELAVPLPPPPPPMVAIEQPQQRQRVASASPKAKASVQAPQQQARHAEEEQEEHALAEGEETEDMSKTHRGKRPSIIITETTFAI
jgi:hypothetical protein